MNSGRHTLEVMNEAKWYNTWLVSLINKYIKGDILEVGAGIGNFSRLISQKGRLTTIDVDTDYIKKFKNVRSISAGFGDIEKGDYFFKSDTKFDAVVCMNVLEHIKNDKKALKNMSGLLKKNGYLILLVPAHKILFSDFDKEIGHYRRYSLSEIDNLLLDLGFKLKISRYINWWSAIGWFVFLKLTGWKKIPGRQVSIFDNLGKLFLFPENYIQSPFGLSVLAIAQK